MTYTTTQLTELTDRSAATIITWLSQKGMQPIGIGEYQVKIWPQESLQIIQDKIESLNHKPDTIAASSLLHKCGVDLQTVRTVAQMYGLQPIWKGKTEIYDYDIVDYISQYVEQNKVDNGNHPLVTDKRCLRLGWFPDTVPKCFEDLDNETT